MTDPRPVPLAAAIERLGEAAQAYLDGPVAHLRAAAERAGRPGYGASTATADAATYGLRVAHAWWGGFNALADATALLAIPPGAGHRFDIPIPAALVTGPFTVRVVDRQWTWMLGPEPAGVSLQVLPPVVLPGGTDVVSLFATPRANNPSWQVKLQVAPVGAGQGTMLLARLDATTEQV
jgi:hypothetical protein